GVLPCLHPDVNSIVANQKQLESFLEHSDPSAMKLCVDSSFLSLVNIPMSKFIKEHKKQIGAVHLRDIKAGSAKKKRGEPGIRYQTTELGKGSLDLEEFVDTL